MEVGQGDAFDAEIHDAVTQIPAPNKSPRKNNPSRATVDHFLLVVAAATMVGTI